ncbi:mitochondrial F1-F0 ATP synthase subunit F of fungi-domain-containing protein [Neurospora hispaniola]|uniref:Mitochondrial F1-F0 ATP synthase subunit F of fungi-domain-containing protein n=1 Tax=Neurospora hispaniola TaxID=588809 RepID=A0AAJ0HZR9_9PEZI|nr:mitochondrial F1-F0 ATP synthase subunit F of fungi-domain-containing protein [Neurospora hispaniola]
MSFVTRRALSTLIPPSQNPVSDHTDTTTTKWRGLESKQHEQEDRIDSKGGNVKEQDDAIGGDLQNEEAIGAAPDAVVMKRVVSFYEKLPRGPAPEIKPQGFWGKYQAKHFGKNPSAKRTSTTIYMLSRSEKKPGKAIVHAIVGLLIVGYAQNYYFHLRHHKNHAH